MEERQDNNHIVTPPDEEAEGWLGCLFILFILIALLACFTTSLLI